MKQGFWKAVRRAGRMVPFMDEVVAAYYCALDQKTPMRVRMTLMAALTAVRAHITPAHRLAARQALEDEAAVGQ
ncbi:hypothetical protein C086_00047 [Brucella abortus F6/05-3]|uniref:hypothetical protein n=1 Tax=Brucella abortus TaxID=235 RepID=UPI0001B49AB9|nr:hypothetical protein [Brucella abortus]AIJ54268.1 hypothetical protein DK51_1370 [Brucella abortus]AIJ77727.1 hypothetical protein DO75_1929 [Brucella abortus]EEX83680.1 conserved hypothetical protein [Brucella abortus bv. 3 str. Tulya]ENP36515.1 hypothetical protein C088_00009 [Brucella abortus 65/110]ENP42104.1 hypothetical protein C055_02026 [Brucella abortus 78/36]